MLVVAAIAGGLLHAVRGFVPVLGLLPMQIHVGAALAAAGLLAAHVLPHRHRRWPLVRRVDLDRRTALRAATVAVGRAGAVGGRAGSGAAVHRLAPGGRAARHAVAVRSGARAGPDGVAAAAPWRRAGSRRARRPAADDRPRGDRLHGRLVGRGGVARGAARGSRAARDRRWTSSRRPATGAACPAPTGCSWRRTRAARRWRTGTAAPRGSSCRDGGGSGGSSGWSRSSRPTSRGGGSRRYPCSDRHITCSPT